MTASSQTSLTTQWSASTDDVAVTGYRLFLNGSPVGTTTATLVHVRITRLRNDVHARRRGVRRLRQHVAANAPDRVDVALRHSRRPGRVVFVRRGLRAVGRDSSGNGHAGTITGATWATGRYGGALDFNGTNASVDLGGLGTFYQSGFTLEAWVQKQSATKNDVAIVGTWNGGGGPMLWVDHIATRYHLTMGNGIASYLDSGRNPIAGQWQHLAATYDGTTARFYIDGTEVASRPVTGGIGSSNNWRIGAYGSSPGGFFDGLIDNVRIYNRSLTPGEITTDMNQAVTTVAPPSSDATPPSAPGTLNSSGSTNQVALNWGAATDNIGVTRYNVHRSTTAGFTPSTSNRIAQPTSTSYTDTGLAAGTYYYKVTAEDAAGNIGPASNESSATVTAPPDSAPPSAPGTLTASASNGQAALSWGAATDNIGVTRYNVHRSTTAGFTPTRATGSRSPPRRATPTPASPPAPTTTRSPPRTPPATSAPASNEASATSTATPDSHRRRPHAHRRRLAGRRRSAGAPRPTTSASPATTSTARRPPASRRPRPTASRSRPGRATPTPASPPAPTTTRSPPRTPPATSAPRRTRRAQQ